MSVLIWLTVYLFVGFIVATISCYFDPCYRQSDGFVLMMGFWPLGLFMMIIDLISDLLEKWTRLICQSKKEKYDR